MRKPIVAGNWKLHGTRSSAASLALDIAKGIDSLDHVEIGVCPPFVHLADVEKLINTTPLWLGAQNVSEHESGAFTGEISAPMLSEFGCKYVIIGHSERRTLFAENNKTICAKIQTVHACGMTPILCIGETLSDRESNKTKSVILDQLNAVLHSSPAKVLEALVVAYEPVWAIGTGKTASPEEAQEVHQLIRERMGQFSHNITEHLRVLYGGSVNASNAAELFAMPDIDGGLIGGASLKREDFIKICKAAEAVGLERTKN
ncbi:MAG: triose-phosphate isomerase [Gammaproteobacteria bacterium]|nr:triose-phosphate isomerase [Gammaproteobacteria bacterium]